MKSISFVLIWCAFLVSLGAKETVEVWNSEGAFFPFSNRLGFFGNFELRSREHRKPIYYKHYQGGLYFVCSSYTFFYLAYRHIFHRLESHWRVERSPLLDWVLQLNGSRGTFLSYRNRAQWGGVDPGMGKKREWVYRGRLEWVFPGCFSGQPFSPYLASEIFWAKERGLYHNRVEGGVKIFYHERALLALSYLRFSERFEFKKKGEHASVIRLHFSFQF